MPVVFWEFLYVAFMSYSYWKLVCWFDGKTKETMYEYLLKNNPYSRESVLKMNEKKVGKLEKKKKKSKYYMNEIPDGMDDSLIMNNLIDLDEAFSIDNKSKMF